MTQLQIEFENEVNLKDFMRWFKKTGYNSFISSDANKGNANNDFITCLVTEEKMDWGYYLELQ